MCTYLFPFIVPLHINATVHLSSLQYNCVVGFCFLTCVSEVQWKAPGEIRSGVYSLYYCRSDRPERGIAIMVHKSVVRSVVKKVVCSDRIIALKVKAQWVSILLVKV